MPNSNSRITVRLDANTQRLLSAAASSSGKSESELIREALSAFLQQDPESESCLDLARRRGLIGVTKKLPPDLSTNRKHFEGFGR